MTPDEVPNELPREIPHEVVEVAIAAALIVAVVLVTFSVYVARAILRPPYMVSQSGKPLSPTAIAFSWGTEKTDPLHDFGLPFEDVEFESVCGHTLRGWFIDRRQQQQRDGNAPRSKDDMIVIFAHGGGRDRRAFLRHTPIVCADGEYVCARERVCLGLPWRGSDMHRSAR